MRRINIYLAALACAFLSVETAQGEPCNAQNGCALPLGTPGFSEKARETKFVAGLQWNLRDSHAELILGARTTETSASSRVRGAKIDLAIPLKASLQDVKPVLRIVGLTGNRDVQGEFGFGLRLTDWKPLAAAGAQVPHANAGVNFVFNEDAKPYLGLNTVKQAPPPRRSAGDLHCQTGYTLLPLSDLSAYSGADPAVVVNGQTCLSAD